LLQILQQVKLLKTTNLPFKAVDYTSYGATVGSRTIAYSSRAGALSTPIAFVELAKSTPQPITATGGVAVRRILDYTPKETTRVLSNVDISYSLQKQKVYQ